MMSFMPFKTNIFIAGIFGLILHVGCSEGAISTTEPTVDSSASKTAKIAASKPSVSAHPFSIETWIGIWEGEQPAYPMRNSAGEPIVVRGMEAMVKASRFTFTVLENGKAILRQEVDDGRIMNFEGTWKGQIDEAYASNESEVTPRLRAIVCDLSAIDTGAYRQYALAVDGKARHVKCIGTSSEPSFVVQFER